MTDDWEPDRLRWELDRLRKVAARAVRCPLCKSADGWYCHSTGGGCTVQVATHGARIARVAAWDRPQVEAAAAAVQSAFAGGRYLRGTDFGEFEAAAQPLRAPGDAPAPGAVRITEVQASWIEQAAELGRLSRPLGHLSGEATARRSLNALAEKGILHDAGRTVDGEYLYALTEYGWEVYRQHSKIIRRLTAEGADAQQQRAECRCHTYAVGTDGDGDVDSSDCWLHRLSYTPHADLEVDPF